MEIVLQHQSSGLFLGGEQEWVGTSREARKFSSAIEAVRFARAARFTRSVRIVVRYERTQGAILMPLMGSLAHY